MPWSPGKGVLLVPGKSQGDQAKEKVQERGLGGGGMSPESTVGEGDGSEAPISPRACMLICPLVLHSFLKCGWGQPVVRMLTMREQSWERVKAGFQRLLCGHLCYLNPGFQAERREKQLCLRDLSEVHLGACSQRSLWSLSGVRLKI